MQELQPVGMDGHIAAAIEDDLKMVAAAPGVLDHIASKMAAVRADRRGATATGRNAHGHFHQAAAAIVGNLQHDLLRVAAIPFAAQKTVAVVGNATGFLADLRRRATGATGRLQGRAIR